MQLTLKNIKTKSCPKCNLALAMCSIDGDTIWYWCYNCVGLVEFTVCRCGKIYQSDGLKYCLDCREKAYEVIKNVE